MSQPDSTPIGITVIVNGIRELRGQYFEDDAPALAAVITRALPALQARGHGAILCDVDGVTRIVRRW